MDYSLYQTRERSSDNYIHDPDGNSLHAKRTQPPACPDAPATVSLRRTVTHHTSLRDRNQREKTEKRERRRLGTERQTNSRGLPIASRGMRERESDVRYCRPSSRPVTPSCHAPHGMISGHSEKGRPRTVMEAENSAWVEEELKKGCPSSGICSSPPKKKMLGRKDALLSSGARKYAQSWVIGSPSKPPERNTGTIGRRSASHGGTGAVRIMRRLVRVTC